MCERSMLFSIIYYVYNFIWIGVPIIYLIAFKLYTSNRKVYIKAVKYTLIWLVVLCIPKFIGWTFVPNTCYNCALNNVCRVKEEEKDMEKDDKNKDNLEDQKTSAKTSSTTTTTKEQQSTTTRKQPAKVLGTSSKGYEIVSVDGATYVNGILVVNKSYPVTENYVPKNTKNKNAASYTGVCNDCIDTEAYEEWTKMKADAASVGINLWIQSGYRPYVLQQKLYNNYAARDGKQEADRYSARPGYSEHQTGLCFDINNPSRSFNGTTEAKWINDNAYRFGFILRYPKDKENETGYMYESWHVRYVGKELALKLYNNGDWITLESYLGITSEYAN